MLSPVPCRSLFRKFRSLIDRFNTLFGRLGIWFRVCFKVNHLPMLILLASGAKPASCQYVPVDLTSIWEPAVS
jgi:hypothetical protein